MWPYVVIFGIFVFLMGFLLQAYHQFKQEIMNYSFVNLCLLEKVRTYFRNNPTDD